MVLAHAPHAPTGPVVVARRDTRGWWHLVTEVACDECGCPFFYALDDPAIIWEAADAVSPDCEDASCRCHVAPVLGLPFVLHMR